MSDALISLVECERLAQDKGFDSMRFIAMFPNGPKNCQWIDAYFGFFKIDGVTDDKSFVTTIQIQDAVGRVMCVPLLDEEDDAA